MPPATTAVLIASADGHVGPSSATFREHLERRYHDAFEDFLAHHQYRWTAAYRLDRTRLNDIAARIGPSPTELGRSA
jgi:hypothetical protein